MGLTSWSIKIQSKIVNLTLKKEVRYNNIWKERIKQMYSVLNKYFKNFIETPPRLDSPKPHSALFWSHSPYSLLKISVLFAFMLIISSLFFSFTTLACIPKQ